MKKMSLFGKTVAFVDSEGKITTPSTCFKVKMPLIYATGCKSFFTGESWYDVLCFIVSKINGTRIDKATNSVLSQLLKGLTYEEYVGELFFRPKKVCVPEEFVLISSFMKSDCFIQMGIRGKYVGICPEKIDFSKTIKTTKTPIENTKIAEKQNLEKQNKKVDRYRKEKWLCMSTYRYPDISDFDIGYSHPNMKKYIDEFMEAF